MKILMMFLTLLLFIPLSLFAGVNLKNGNYYVTYTDLIATGGGHDLMVQRTYNSKSIDMGWFGFGWGSDFETYLVVSPDGSVTIHENGTGAANRFVQEASLLLEIYEHKLHEVLHPFLIFQLTDWPLYQ